MSQRSPYATPRSGGGGGGGRTSYYQRSSAGGGVGAASSYRRGRDEDPEERSRNWMRNMQQAQRSSSGDVFTPAVSAQFSSGGGSSGFAAPLPPVAPTPISSAAAASSASSSGSSGGGSLSGIVMNALTPFDGAGNVDARLIGEYASAARADGVRGAVLLSPSVGEGASLSPAEQDAVITAWARSGLATAVWVNAGGPAGASIVQAAQRAGANCVIVGSNAANYDAAPSDAARFVASVFPAGLSSSSSGRIGVLVVVPPALLGSAADEFITAVARLDGFEGIVATQLGHVVAAAASGKCATVLFSSVAGDDLQCVSAAAAGATGVVSDHSSVIAPLLARLFAAGAKGDSAGVAKMGKLFAQYLSGFPARPLLHTAALKALLSLRLDLSAALDVRPPTPQLSAGDTSRLKQRMEQFVKNYIGTVSGTPAPATAAAASSSGGGTTINVMAMPGYRGKLNDLIVRRIEACERLTGKSGMIDKFPHLRYPDGSWRTRRPGGSPAQYIDHTLLKPEAKEEEVVKLVNEAKTNNFYAVCVNGCRAARCVEMCRGSSVRVAAVIGFPLGAMTVRAKAEEAGELVHEIGVGEIDMVMNVGAFKDKNYRLVYEDIKAVVKASAPAIVKVIFETCLLTQEETIDASILSVFAGAQFIKTSTGFNKGGATPDAIDAMLAVAGNESDVKASGGVRDFASAMAYINAGVMRIGTSSGVAIVAGKPAGAGY